MGYRWTIDDSAKPDPSQVGVPTTGLSFLELPAEIRNEIYHLSCLRDTTVRLWRFQPPALARVNRRLRGEALSVYFGANVFVAEISAPYKPFYSAERPVHWPRGAFMLDTDVAVGEVGVLRLSRDTTFSFEALGKSMAYIKNLDVVLCWDPRSGTERERYKMYHDLVVSMRSSSTLDSDKPTVTVSRELHPDRGTADEAHYVDDMKKLAAPLKDFLDRKIAQEGFQGLTVSDMQQLAKTVLLPQAMW